MNVKDWFKQVAYLKFMSIEGINDKDIPKSWFSKFDDSYITFEGLEEGMKLLADREITEQLTHGVGFSPKNNKWYGWSHRAIYGFKIGSTCKKGDCHYIGSTLEEQRKGAIEFWKDEDNLNVRCVATIIDGEDSFFDIKWDYSDKIPNKKLRNTIGGCLHHIEPLGKGEWIAETMEDAKQMAIDFNRGVS